jgi:hypothetical protein
MEEGNPSATAILIAMLRAAHLLWDYPPKIFEDTLALRHTLPQKRHSGPRG